MASDTSVGGLWWLNDAETVATEILNSDRARMYNFNHPLFGGPRCTSCGCSTLKKNPLTGSVVTYGANPAAGPAPWITSLSASNNFLGFIVDEIIGLDYSHYDRTISQKAGDGSNATPLRAAGREITFTLLATALDEAAMRYGLDWLARELGDIGGRCGSGSMLLYLNCSNADNVADGRVVLHDVSLKKAPQFTGAPFASYEGLVREIMFTVVANDPCYYTAKSVCLATTANYTLPTISLQTEICTNAKSVANFLCGPIKYNAYAPPAGTPFCGTNVSSPLETRAQSVIIQNVSGTSGPFMVESYVGAPGIATAALVNSGATFLGRIGVDTISGTEGVMVDGVTGLVWYRPSSVAAWTPDDGLIKFPDGEFPFFPRYTGDLTLYVMVRPYFVCNGGGQVTVTINSTSVLGCIVD